MTKSNKQLAKILPSSIAMISGMSEEDLALLDFTALPTIVNDGEVIKVKGADWDLPKDGFEAIILTVTPYKYHRCSNPDHAVPGFYTYDNITTTKNEPIEDILNIWEQDGVQGEVKDYLELKVDITSEGPANHALAIVNISPTSVKRTISYIQLTLGRQHKLKCFQAITRFSTGDKVRGKGGKMFAPWVLSFVGEAEVEVEDNAAFDAEVDATEPEAEVES